MEPEQAQIASGATSPTTPTPPSSLQLLIKTIQCVSQNMRLFWWLLAINTLVYGTSVYSISNEAVRGEQLSTDIIEVLINVLMIFLGVMASAGLLYGYTHSASRPTAKAIFTWTNKHIGPLLWISILMFCTVYGGLLLLIVPGIVALIVSSLSLVVLAAEDRRGLDALLRSRQLIEGNFWKTLLTLLLAGLFSALLYLVSFFVTAMAAVIFAAANGETSELFVTIISAVTFIPLLTVGTAFNTAVLTVLYHQYKNAKPPLLEYSESRSRYQLFAILGVIAFFLINYILLSLGTAGHKAEDALMKLQLSHLRTSIELSLVDDTYRHSCDLVHRELDVPTITTFEVTCIDSDFGYSIEAKLSNEYFCVAGGIDPKQMFFDSSTHSLQNDIFCGEPIEVTVPESKKETVSTTTLDFFSKSTTPSTTSDHQEQSESGSVAEIPTTPQTKSVQPGLPTDDSVAQTMTEIQQEFEEFKEITGSYEAVCDFVGGEGVTQGSPLKLAGSGATQPRCVEDGNNYFLEVRYPIMIDFHCIDSFGSNQRVKGTSRYEVTVFEEVPHCKPACEMFAGYCSGL